MQKVRIFSSIESELRNLEEEVNQWIVESGAKIISMTGNIAPQSTGSSHVGTFSASDVLLMILYDDPKV